MKENMANGILQGYYREGLDAEVIARCMVGGAGVLADQNLFPRRQVCLILIFFGSFCITTYAELFQKKGLNYIEEHNLFKAQTKMNKEMLKSTLPLLH